MYVSEDIWSLKGLTQDKIAWQARQNTNLVENVKETRYDSNLTIMKSHKQATDNRLKKLIKSYL